MGDWCTIESDPGVFTEMISKFGVTGVQVDEIIDIDNLPHDALGLIFLFKCLPKLVLTQPDTAQSRSPDYVSFDTDVFFANQVITNACATQAILSILLNLSGNQIDVGQSLRDFREFTHHFPSDLKGEAINNSDLIRNVHNSFAKSDPFQLEVAAPQDEKDDVFHFISFVPVNGKLYELDGLQAGPIHHPAAREGCHWLETVKPLLQSRMQSFSTGSTGEIKFNLMALVPDRLTLLRAQLPSCGESDCAQIEMQIRQEEDVRKRWAKENQRRRANFIGLVYSMLKEMGSKGMLDEFQ
ncbi:MAG: hypothetical protein SGCHY_002674 [Lobulomycetales sp.]